MENPIDTLEIVIGGIKIKDMGAMSFYQWVAKKLNGVLAYKADTVELTMLVSNPPMSRTVPNEEKIRIIAKMRKLDIQIP